MEKEIEELKLELEEKNKEINGLEMELKNIREMVQGWLKRPDLFMRHVEFRKIYGFDKDDD